MTQFLAVKADSADFPVLHIDTDAPLTALADCALHRIGAGTGLLDSLLSLKLEGVDDIDLKRIGTAAYLLCQDGMDVLAVMRHRLG